MSVGVRKDDWLPHFVTSGSICPLIFLLEFAIFSLSELTALCVSGFSLIFHSLFTGAINPNFSRWICPHIGVHCPWFCVSFSEWLSSSQIQLISSYGWVSPYSIHGGNLQPWILLQKDVTEIYIFIILKKRLYKKALPNKNHNMLHFIVIGEGWALGVDSRALPISLFSVA